MCFCVRGHQAGLDCPALKLRMSYTTILPHVGSRAWIICLYIIETYYLGVADKTNFVLRSILYQNSVLQCVCESFALWAKASGCRVVKRTTLYDLIVLPDLLVVPWQSACPCHCPANLTCRTCDNHLCEAWVSEQLSTCLLAFRSKYCGVQRWFRSKMYCRLTLRSVKRPKKGLKWFCSRKHWLAM